MTAGGLRRSAAVGALAAALGMPARAAARIGPAATVATDYEATVDPLGPGLRGVHAQAVEGDRRLWLRVDRALTLTVLGYLGEPLLRFSPAGVEGVEVNLRSPTAVADGLAPKKPEGRRPGGLAVLAAGFHGPLLRWHDARPRPVPAAGGPGRVLGGWSVPVVVDGRRAVMRGESRYSPAPPWWPWLIPLAVAAAGTVVLLRRRDPDEARAAARALAVCAVAGGITSLAGREVDVPAIAGDTRLEVIPACVLAAALLVALVRGGPGTRRGAALIAAVLAVLEGLALVTALRHGVVLSALPPDLARGAAALGLLAGASVIVILLADAGWQRAGGRPRGS